MPSNSTGQIAIVVDVVAETAHEFSTQDTIAHVSRIPLGGTLLTLPAPLPSDGDAYEFADLDGSCNPARRITLSDPNGRPIAGAPAPQFFAPFSWAKVRYDAKARAWSLMQAGIGGGGSGGIIHVADAAALAAFPAVVLALGAIAYTDSFAGAYWSLEPARPAVPGAVVTASDGRAWVRYAAPNAAAAIAQTGWKIDPIGGDDEFNDGTAAAPLRSLAERYRRMGTTRPSYSTIVTVQLASDIPASDPWLERPLLETTGALTCEGTLVLLATATIGVFTQRNRVAGTPNTITAAGKPANFWAPFLGKLVHDVTADAWFTVLADLGAATAEIGEPLAGAQPVPAEITIANGDSLTIHERTGCNVEIADCDGIGAQFLFVNFRFVRFNGFLMSMGRVSLDRCQWVDGIAIGTSASQINATNCDVDPSIFVTELGGLIVGGTYRAPMILQGTELATSALDGDVIFTGLINANSRFILGNAAFFGANSFFVGSQPNTLLLQLQNYGPPHMWGTAAIKIGNATQFGIAGVTAVNGLLCTGGYTIDGAALAPAAVDGAGFVVGATSGARVFIET
jgi:hypothetical protein